MVESLTQPDDRSAATRWLDRFFESYYRLRPVNATFIGVHDHDHRLPDFDALTEMRGLLASAPTTADTWAERIDLRLATGFLEIQLWECQSRHFHRGNPCCYTGEAIFGAMSLFLTDFAPLGQRVESAIARLEATPAFLDRGIAAIRQAPIHWTERAIRECRGALSFLTEGIARLMADDGITDPRLQRAADHAALAFTRFQHHLETDLRGNLKANVECGEAALSRYLTKGHCLVETADEIAARATAELDEATAELARRSTTSASDLRFGVERYQSLWLEVRRIAEEHRLLTWPEFPIRFAPRPGWAQAAAPDLYFLYYRSPAALNRPAVHDYLIPSEDQPETAIKLNHVIHHGGIGHHVQNWHAFRAASRLGRVAAVDCASRIAMFSGGTMAEGWACYATDLMEEVGFLTPAEQLDELRTHRRMCARAVVDVRLHQGRMTLDQATEYYHRHTGMSAEAASNESVKNSMFPGAALMYFVGRGAIHRLRREVSRRLGARFNLRDFHDQFLSYGSIPVSLIADDMIRQLDAPQ